MARSLVLLVAVVLTAGLVPAAAEACPSVALPCASASAAPGDWRLEAGGRTLVLQSTAYSLQPLVVPEAVAVPSSVVVHQVVGVLAVPAVVRAAVVEREAVVRARLRLAPARRGRVRSPRIERSVVR